MANLINIDALQREAKTYEAALQILPFEKLTDPLTKLGINLIDVNDKNVIVSFDRKGGLSRPYVAGDPDDDFDAGEIGKVKERELSVEPCVLVVREHVRNYKQYQVITGQPGTDNKEKKHPLERIILENIVKTTAEDIIDAMFHAKRDENDPTPFGMFDGFNEIIDAEVSAGDIAESKGNLVPTGAISAPATTSDTDAVDILVEFLQAADPKLGNNCTLLIDRQTLAYVIKALENKTQNHTLVNFQILLDHLRSVSLLDNLNVVTHPCLGVGGRLILTQPGNFDLGLKTRSDIDFVQVRQFYKDANWVQYWMQYEAGSRIRNVHSKMFQVNDQINTARQLSGDYRS